MGPLISGIHEGENGGICERKAKLYLTPPYGRRSCQCEIQSRPAFEDIGQ
jgi:hypothetical protein